MVNKKLDIVINLAWRPTNNNTQSLQNSSQVSDQSQCPFFFVVKVNKSSLIMYTQTPKPGIKRLMSALLDAKNVNAGSHQLGQGMEFQAEMDIVQPLDFQTNDDLALRCCQFRGTEEPTLGNIVLGMEVIWGGVSYG